MPKAAVGEDHLTSAKEDKIRFSGHVLAVKPVAVPHGIHQAAHDQFRLRIFTADTTHVLTAADTHHARLISR